MVGEMLWINSVYFIKFVIQYRALTEGYIGDSPGRKLRAILKEIVQGISPCLNKDDTMCQECSLKENCCFFHLMVEDRHKDYLPYFIIINNGHDWQGPISRGSRHSFEICLVGDKTTWSEDLAMGLRQKKLISLDGIAHQKVRFELLSLDLENNGKPIGIADLLPRYTETGAKGFPKVEQLAVAFITPHSITYNNKTITSPKDLDFRVFLSALHKRVSGLAMGHCCFKGDVPGRSQFIS